MAGFGYGLSVFIKEYFESWICPAFPVAVTHRAPPRWSFCRISPRPCASARAGLGTHGGMLAGFLGNRINIPPIGIGVSRDAADQDPLVHKEAQAVADLLGLAELTA